ncbi:MAG: serine hydrolase [Pirellulales bacterium]
MLRAFCARVLMCAFAAISMVSPACGLDLKSQIDPLAQPLVDQGKIVGMVIGILRDGETQVLAYGETVKGSGKNPDGRTVYEIGSATKAFTGDLLADAVLAGRMKLDDPAQNYMPKAVTMPEVDGKPITLEHLATHTSGLPRLPDNMKFGDPMNPYADYTGKQLADFLNGHKLRRPPGEYEYSNLGMGLLGMLLARESKKPYEALLIDHITKPIGMTDTNIKLNKSQQERLAPPYDAQLRPKKNWDIPTLAGAGAVRSTADDMLKFLKTNMAEDDKALTKSLQFAREKRHTMKDGGAIGLGWHLHGDGITWWHNGQTGGYSSWMGIVPPIKVGVVVLTNTATDLTTQLGTELTQVACGIPVAPPAKREEFAVDAKVLESYVGNYEIVPEFVLTVTVEYGQLIVQATGQGKLPFYAQSPTKFFCKLVDAQISFKKNKAGKVTQLILHQNGRNMPGKRQE